MRYMSSPRNHALLFVVCVLFGANISADVVTARPGEALLNEYLDHQDSDLFVADRINVTEDTVELRQHIFSPGNRRFVMFQGASTRVDFVPPSLSFYVMMPIFESDTEIVFEGRLDLDELHAADVFPFRADGNVEGSDGGAGGLTRWTMLAMFSDPDVDVREQARSSNQVSHDDPRWDVDPDDIAAKNAILVWIPNGISKVEFQAVNMNAKSAHVQTSTGPGRQPVNPKVFYDLPGDGTKDMYLNIPANHDGSTGINMMDFGYDADGSGRLHRESFPEQEIYGRFDIVAVQLEHYNIARGAFVDYTLLMSDFAEANLLRFANGSYPIPDPLGPDYRPTSTAANLITEVGAIVHNVGCAIAPKAPKVIGGKPYYNADLTINIHDFNASHPLSQAIREHDAFKESIQASLVQMGAAVHAAYVAAGGGTTRSITLNMPDLIDTEGRPDFGPGGNVGLGRANRRSGTVGCDATPRSGGGYDLVPTDVNGMKIEDIFDFTAVPNNS